MQEHYDKAIRRIYDLADSGRMTEEQLEKAVDRIDRVFMRDNCTPESLANVADYYEAIYNR